jgi:hypothetical protein
MNRPPATFSELLNLLDATPQEEGSVQGDVKRARPEASSSPGIVTKVTHQLQAEASLDAPRILVVCAAGPGSLHAGLWERWGEAQVDLCIVWFGAEEPPATPGARCVLRAKGPKWQLVRMALNSGVPDWRRTYDYVWIPDDDVKWEYGDLVGFVRGARAFGFQLSQPCLVDVNITSGAYRSVLTRASPKAVAHRTNFVEIMAPLFTAAALSRVFCTFDNDVCKSGWGLDQVWPALLDRRKIGVVDACCLRHTRPPNNFKAGYQAGVQDPRAEELELMTRYRVDSFYKKVLEVFEHDFAEPSGLAAERVGGATAATAAATAE